MHENEIGTVIVDSAVLLHQDLGPGLLEIAYEATLARKLEKRGLSVQRQVPIPAALSNPVPEKWSGTTKNTKSSKGKKGIAYAFIGKLGDGRWPTGFRHPR